MFFNNPFIYAVASTLNTVTFAATPSCTYNTIIPIMDQYYYVCHNDLFYAVQIFRPCNGVLAGGRTKTALTLEDVKHVTEFLLNFADQHGLVLPGRVPGFARDNLRILPSHFTRKAIWQLYDAADSAAVIHKVRLRAFCQL